MSHLEKTVVAMVASSVFAGLGCVAWMQATHDASAEDVRPGATRSSSVVPASGRASPFVATVGSTKPAVVARDGLLTIRAQGAPLADVLAAVTRSVAVTFAADGEIVGDVSVELGPRPVREVVSALLERASYGYAFIDSRNAAGEVAATRVLLVRRGSAVERADRTRPQPPSVWPAPDQADGHAPPPDERALKQQRAVDAMFDACRAQACDTS